MGDAAEAKFEEVATAQGMKFVRFGLDRPDFTGREINELPDLVRYAPDYLTPYYMVECQGIGRDQVVKLKLDKYAALNEWHGKNSASVVLFVWDSHKKRHAQLRLDYVTEMINQGKATLDYFPEGKAYFAIPASEFFPRAREVGVAA